MTIGSNTNKPSRGPRRAPLNDVALAVFRALPDTYTLARLVAWHAGTTSAQAGAALRELHYVGLAESRPVSDRLGAPHEWRRAQAQPPAGGHAP